mmetsp:Transcript_5326/g.15519  ORF Transcript_5326/g.15519 Transcript_5326/m.15519 type:complete len:220 (+) Transcript_5326:1-660(+)
MSPNIMIILLRPAEYIDRAISFSFERKDRYFLRRVHVHCDSPCIAASSVHRSFALISIEQNGLNRMRWNGAGHNGLAVPVPQYKIGCLARFVEQNHGLPLLGGGCLERTHLKERPSRRQADFATVIGEVMGKNLSCFGIVGPLGRRGIARSDIDLGSTPRSQCATTIPQGLQHDAANLLAAVAVLQDDVHGTLPSLLLLDLINPERLPPVLLGRFALRQ